MPATGAPATILPPGGEHLVPPSARLILLPLAKSLRSRSQNVRTGARLPGPQGEAGGHAAAALRPALIVLAVFLRRHAGELAESLRKIAEGGEVQDLRDLGNAVVGALQQVFGLKDAAIDHIVNGADAVRLLEQVPERILVHADDVRKSVQRQILVVVLVDILLDPHRVLVDRPVVPHIHAAHARVGQPLQFNQQQLQDALAGVGIVRLPMGRLPLQHLQQGEHFLPARGIVQQGIPARGGAVELQPAHPEHGIRQRAISQALLRMLHIRIDQHEISPGDAQRFILNQETSRPARAEKHLRAGVRMADAVPVVLKTGGREIQQLAGRKPLRLR